MASLDGIVRLDERVLRPGVRDTPHLQGPGLFIVLVVLVYILVHLESCRGVIVGDVDEVIARWVILLLLLNSCWWRRHGELTTDGFFV